MNQVEEATLNTIKAARSAFASVKAYSATTGRHDIPPSIKKELYLLAKDAETWAKNIKDATATELKTDNDSIPGLGIKMSYRENISDVRLCASILQKSFKFTTADLLSCASLSFTKIKQQAKRIFIDDADDPDMTEHDLYVVLDDAIAPAITKTEIRNITVAK